MCIFWTSWNEWISLPHLFSELPRTAMLVITILDCAGAGQTNVIGGTTISLFGKDGVFRQVDHQFAPICVHLKRGAVTLETWSADDSIN